MNKILVKVLSGIMLTGAIFSLVSKQSFALTKEEAKQLALDYVDGTIISSSEDKDDYGFKISYQDVIYDIDVDKQTGKIDDIDQEKVNASFTKEQAQQVALDYVQGTIISSSEDKDDYEFKISYQDVIYDIDVDKATRKIDDVEKENVSNKITQEEAKRIALNQINGTITDLEYDDGYYDIEIKQGKEEYDIKIDGQSGKVIKLEKDD